MNWKLSVQSVQGEILGICLCPLTGEGLLLDSFQMELFWRGTTRPGRKEKTMPLDHYLTLGRSGLRVSPFCLGAMTFGEDLGWGSSVKESEAIIDRYLELGGNFIDTANVYTKGHSKKIIAEHVRRDPNKRDRLAIASQVSR